MPTMNRRTIDIAEITIRKRHRGEMGDVAALAASIEDVGLLHPVVVGPELQLISGARRIAACALLGRTKIDVTIAMNLDDVVSRMRAERDENTCRKEFRISEAVSLAEDLLEFERKQAKARMQKGGGDKRSKNGSEKFSDPILDQGKALDKVGDRVGLSRPTLAKAREVIAAAKADETFAPLVEKMDRTGKVNGVYRRMKVEEARREIAAEPPVLPTGPFRVIVADPPWTYEVRTEDPTRHGVTPYPTMTIEAITALDVASIAHEDSVLWLWTTNSHIKFAFSILSAWGFNYETMLTWVKPKVGLGTWLRGQTEHCLMASRGRPVIQLVKQTTALIADRGEHSSKPDAFYELVESLCPGSRCELFQRRPRDGWIGFGNEVPR